MAQSVARRAGGPKVVGSSPTALTTNKEEQAVAPQPDSVRLVHSHGLPQEYTVNQVYVPTDERLRGRGMFFILVNHRATQSGEAISSAVTLLIRDFYRPGTTGGLDGFEHALLRVNEQVRRMTTVAEPEISGVIVLLADSEIHVTFIGRGGAFLVRDASVLVLAAEAKTKPGAAAFSVITSGEIKIGDTLFLLAGLNCLDEDWIKQSLLFTAGQTPVKESGRALARILLAQDERTAEAIVTRFNSTPGEIEIIALDKSLDTPAEKIDRWRTRAQAVASLISPVAKVVWTGVSRLRARALPTPVVAETPADAAEPSRLDGVGPGPSKELANFAVMTYKRTTSLAPVPVSPVTAGVIGRVGTFIGQRRLKTRTGLVLAATVILTIVGIAAYNRLAGPKTEQAKTTAAERDALVKQAETLARAADAAQAQDDPTTAIAKLLEAQTIIDKIPAKWQNETSQALGRRAASILTKLTRTVELKPAVTVAVANQPVKLVFGGGAVYVFGGAPVATKVKDGASESVILGEVTFLDAVAFDGGKQIAALVADSGGVSHLVRLDPNRPQPVAPIERTDGQPWPPARLIASYQSNLYLAGATIIKAIPGGDKYQMVKFTSDADTSSVSSLLNNGTVFYALENNQINRLAANSPKTAIKFFGVPESFWPKKITRLIESGQEGVLLLLDAPARRLISISTDGGYKGQYRLVGDAPLIDCTKADHAFACVTATKTVETYPLP